MKLNETILLSSLAAVLGLDTLVACGNSNSLTLRNITFNGICPLYIMSHPELFSGILFHRDSTFILSVFFPKAKTYGWDSAISTV